MSRETGRRSWRVGPSKARDDRAGTLALVSSSMARALGALALAIGAVVLAIPGSSVGEPTSWESLLAPYSTGAPLPDGFRVQEIRRGPDNGIVISVRRPDGGAAVEVLVVERGRWKSVHESQSFTIDYELPHSPAAEREVITALLAETIRSRDHGLPAPDALPLRPDEVGADASVLPWWLEVLRGLRGVLLGATLILLALLALVRAPVLVGLGVALGAIDVTARLVGVPLLRPGVGAVWIVPAALGLLGLALRDRWSRSRTDLRLALAVAAVALVLRLGLGPWGPLHVNGHGPRFVAGAVHDPADIAAYGPGYHEIFGPIAALAPSSPDWAIFACNAFFSALLPPLGFAIGRLTGLGARAAFAVALLLALDPVALRMGATEAYFAPIAFFCTAASAAMLVALREMEMAGRWRAAALLVAAGLLLSQAARIHPCAWVLMATVPFVLLAGDCGSWRRRALMAVAAAVVSGGVLLCTSSTALLDVLGNIRAGTVFRPTPPSLWPLAWVALVAAGYVFVLRPLVVPRRLLALPAAVSLAAMLLTRHAFDASWIWEQSYFRLYLTLPLIAAVACVPPAWFDRRWHVVSAAAVLGLAWIRIGWPVVADRSLEHREYRWVREQLELVPPECRVVHLGFAGRRVLLLPTYVGAPRPAVAMDPHRPATVEA
ncbi:MAG: hypothetical protein ABIR79_02530, partial [Candidatus Binatia bacterium]